MSLLFSEFVDLLPRPKRLALAHKMTGVEYVADENPCFVEPTLSRSDSEPFSEQPAVVLLSAPGAVGKSTFAAELARRTGATLWNLAQFQVGSNTFTGTFTKAFSSAAGEVLANIRSGEFLVILDAIDEAAVRAGPQNLDAFL